jgi:acyl-[acyl-carrier-protein]-phospholipid O-acyltransferase/long-chain-fatty-acid--[acyl-carrier-protein] ligase
LTIGDDVTFSSPSERTSGESDSLAKLVPAPAKTVPSGVWSLSFIGYLLMSFLTAVNDNMFRWLIIPVAKRSLSRSGSLDQATLESRESLILSLGLASLVLPLVVFAPWSGWMSDRFSKRTTTIWLKLAEVVLVVLGLWSIQLSHLPLMFIILFLLGTHSALLSTAKFAIIPELVPRNQISLANGCVALVTLVAVIVGTIVGNELAAIALKTETINLLVPSIALLSVAIVGVIGSIWIARVPPADTSAVFPREPFSSSWRDLKLVISDRAVFRVTLGITFFWSLASLAQLNIDTFVIRELHLSQVQVGIFLAMLALGVGIGSVVAGWWSGGRVELGMVPLGALLMAAACILLFFCSRSVYVSAGLLALVGLGGGLFNVPLNAYLQERSPHQSLGAILAAGNQLTAIGMVAVSGLFWLLRGPFQLSPSQIFLVCGLGIFPIVCYIVWLMPQATIRFFVWLLSRFVYSVRTYNIENIPERGSALLVANHVSWVDGVMILLASSRPIRMVAYADYVQGPVIGRLADLFGIIRIRSGDGPRALMQSLNTARDALIAGELVCIFAEGQITRSGQLLKFERGMTRILKGTNAPVIPVYLDELWGSVFSHEGGKFFWKKPRNWPYPVSISFGSPITDVDDVDQVRHAVLELGAQSVERRKERMMIPAQRMIRQCRLAWRRLKVADSAGAELTGGRLLTGSLAFHRLLTKSVLVPDANMVGILLPPSVGGVLANTAVSLAGKVAVNLNYTLTEDVVNYCIREAGIRQVLTSRRFLEKRPFQLNAELIFLEDLKDRISGLDKLRALATARLMPAGLLSRRLGLNRIRPDDVMTIIFTSGSTGEPKGVMLSQNNIGSNVEAARQLLNLRPNDGLLGVLPFFHSFGYTVAMWLPLCAEPSGVYHFNPLDARVVGKLIEKYRTTILAATPTFLRSYLKRCTVDELKSLNLVIVGAEKLPEDLRIAFHEKFGFSPAEGYGTTELSPVVSINIPESRIAADMAGQVASKYGTVGRVIPGSAAAVFHPETGEKLGVNQEGMLKIKGPNVMLGYLNHPEKTAELIQDGWYTTGDIAVIDDDGFIRITGRQSRFSKIGGEMVPHIRIENELSRILDEQPNDEPEILCAVTSVPDPTKGERLIVLHKPMKLTVREVTDRLQAAGLPNLWIPGSDSFLEVESIPLLGTGKLDLRGIKDVAMAHFGG